MNKKIYIPILTAFIVLFAVSAGFIIKHYTEAAKQEELYDSLAVMVEEEPAETAEPIQLSETKTILPEYADLFTQNSDMVGWITVEDTKINYPVMQSKDEPDFYLKHGFDKEYSNYGCPYVQENCDVQKPSDNLIIYGHHMKDGSMFTGLMEYTDKGFWEQHRRIHFNTLTDLQEYEVVSVFKTFVYSDSPDSFKYYHFVDAEDEEEFNAYIEKCKSLSLYDTGVTAEYGDKLISLSTCEYSRNNGRLVVVAKLITEEGTPNAPADDPQAAAESQRPD